MEIIEARANQHRAEEEVNRFKWALSIGSRIAFASTVCVAGAAIVVESPVIFVAGVIGAVVSGVSTIAVIFSLLVYFTNLILKCAIISNHLLLLCS